MTDLAASVQQLSEWLAATTIDELELKGPSTSLRLVRSPSRAPGELGLEAFVDDGEADLVGVTAGSPGVFLDRHPWQERSIAPVGTEVSQGATIGFLRVGPLLIPVASPADGVVAQRHAPHGELVGFADRLVSLEPLTLAEPPESE